MIENQIKECLQFFGPLTPIEVKFKLMLRGQNFDVDYLANVMFLEASKQNGLFRFAEADFSFLENRLYKI